MEFGLKGTSRICRGRHEEVGIVEFGLNDRSVMVALSAGRNSGRFFCYLYIEQSSPNPN